MLEEDVTMEELAMNGSKMEKKAKELERKRLRHLVKVKRELGVDEAYSDEPLEVAEIMEAMLRMLEGLKDPVTKKVLGKKYKSVINSFIDAVAGVKVVAKNEVTDVMTKV